MANCKPIATPLAANVYLSLRDEQLLDDPTFYRSIVGALQYCTLIQPDISFVVNKTCQFLHAPTTVHLQAMKCILQYLKGTVTHGIMLTVDLGFHLTYFTDAD